MSPAFVEAPIRISTRPTWVDVSLLTLRRNLRVLQEHAGKRVHVCAVVKADAYGHGATECSLALQAEGVRWFGVTSLDEAVPLREAGISGRILLMSGFWRGEEEEIIRLDLTPIVWEPGQVESLNAAAARLRAKNHPVHLKVDTGMGRLGVRKPGLPGLSSAFNRARHLSLEGLSTHLASSEAADDPSVAEQIRRFEEARLVVRQEGLEPTLLHLANSCAVVSLHLPWSNMVRPGLALYGYHLPFQRAGRQVGGDELSLAVRPVLQWKTAIMAVFDAGPHEALGYGGTYITKSASRIAALPVGYGDGLNRALSNQGRVIVRGYYAPIVGRISMDLTLVDVTGIPEAVVGDEVILIGSSDGLTVDAQEHARLARTIPYEVLCAISKRVPRKYHGREP